MQNGTPRPESSDSFPRSTSVGLKVGVDGDGLGEQQLVWDHQQPQPRHKTSEVLVRGPSRCVNHVHILWDSSLHLLGRVKTFHFFHFFILLILDLILSAALSGLKLFQQSATWMGPHLTTDSRQWHQQLLHWLSTGFTRAGEEPGRSYKVRQHSSGKTLKSVQFSSRWWL